MAWHPFDSGPPDLTRHPLAARVKAGPLDGLRGCTKLSQMDATRRMHGPAGSPPWPILFLFVKENKTDKKENHFILDCSLYLLHVEPAS
jgi:hypothetical protein